MTLQGAVSIAKSKYLFAKYLNYAYSVEPFFCMVFTKKKVPGEIRGGTMVVVNKKTSKSTVLPVRPQTLQALRNRGTLTKVYSVMGGD